MKSKFLELKKFNWRLWITLCVWALIPAVYQTVRTFIISVGCQNEVFDIIAQMEWFDLINETLQAFLIIPLYSILNRVLKSHKKSFAEITFKTGFVSFVIYTLFSIGVLIYGTVLVDAMNPAEIDITAVSNYLQFETIAFMIGIIINFMFVVFVVLGKNKNFYIFLSVRTVLLFIADFLLIPNFGIYGVAVSNIIVNILLAIVSIWILYKENYIQLCRFKKTDYKIFKEWCRIGVFSGLQQFIDNLIYAVMICKMVNMVAEQGNYWNANNFIWCWLLIPITALNDIIRRDCKDGYHNLKKFNYYLIVGITAFLWLISIPLWTPFYTYAEHLPNANEIFLITVKLIPFYIAYAGSSIIDNIFIGLGKTVYNAINSLLVNIIYYGIFYVLYLAKIITFNMNTIILMFGFGMIVHWVISIIEECFLRRSPNTKQDDLN